MIQFQLCETAKQSDIKMFQDSGKWCFSRKLDGERAMWNKGRLINRGGRDITHLYPEIDFRVGEKVLDAVLDGEIASIDDNFNKILMRNVGKEKVSQRAKEVPVKFFVFDLLALDGEDMRGKPLKARLDALQLLFHSNVALSNVELLPYTEDGLQLWKEVSKAEGEGIIAKNLDSAYEGKRSWAWQKIKLWKEGIVEFQSYELMPHGKGITLTNKEGMRLACLGEQSREVRQLINSKGNVEVVVQYLERTKEGAYRFPSFRGVNNDAK